MPGVFRARQDFIVVAEGLTHFVLRGHVPYLTLCEEHDLGEYMAFLGPDTRCSFQRSRVTCLECLSRCDTRCSCDDACCVVCNPKGKRY